VSVGPASRAGRPDRFSERERRGDAVVHVIARAVPLLLVIAAEGAWISVLAGLVHEYALRDPVIGLPTFAGFVLAGALIANAVSHRLGPRWPRLALGLVAVGGVAGVLLASGARGALAASGYQGLGGAVGENPGGLLAGLAVLRGFGHAPRTLREDTVSRLLGGGILLIAFLALAGSLVADPWRSRFLADTLTACLVFVAAAILALALTRQRLIGLESHIDWPRNPAWVGLLVLVLGVALVLAVPLAAVAPQVIDVTLALALGPLLVAGMIAGWTRSSIRLAAFAFVVYVLYTAFSPQLGGVPRAPAGSGLGASEQSARADQTMLVIGGGVLTVVAIIGILILVRLWMRQIATQPTDVDEVRTIDRGGPAPARAARRLRLPFGRAPGDAVSAYRALLRDIEPVAAVRRAPAETPAEHARRLRAAGHAGLSLELLAADYSLVRFGGRRLTPREDRRAVNRWRRLRRPLSRIADPPLDPAIGELAPPG
jgi:hypothetical protein